MQTAKTHGTLVSVSTVRVSPDLSIARAYLSIFPSAKAPEMIESINKSAKTIRYELAKRVRYQLRKTPSSRFISTIRSTISRISTICSIPTPTPPQATHPATDQPSYHPQHPRHHTPASA